MNEDIDIMVEDDLCEAYDEGSLQNGVRGKYVDRLRTGTNVVRLVPDVAAAFPNEDAVNDALRLLLRLAKTKVPQAL